MMDFDPTQPQSKQQVDKSAVAGNVLGSMVAGAALGAVVGAVASEVSHIDSVQASMAHSNYELGSKPIVFHSSDEANNIASAALKNIDDPVERMKLGIIFTDKDPNWYEQAANSAKNAMNRMFPDHVVKDYGTSVDLGNGQVHTVESPEALQKAVENVKDDALRTELQQWTGGYNKGQAANISIITEQTQADTQLQNAPKLSEAAIAALKQSSAELGVSKGTIPLAQLEKFDNIHRYEVEIDGVKKSMLLDSLKFDRNKLIDIVQKKGGDLVGDLDMKDGVKWGAMIGASVGGLRAADENKRDAVQEQAYANSGAVAEYNRQQYVAQALLMRRAAQERQAQEASWRTILENGESQGAARQSGWQDKVQSRDAQTQSVPSGSSQSQTVEAGEKKWGATVNTENAQSSVGAASGRA